MAENMAVTLVTFGRDGRHFIGNCPDSVGQIVRIRGNTMQAGA